MARDQLTLRLSSDALDALAKAHAAVGPVVALHKLAVLALTRGARELAANPALILAAPVEAPAPVASATTKASADASEARRVGRWGDITEADATRLARDLEALRDRGELGAALTAAAVPTGNVYSWLKARREGEDKGIAEGTYRKLRTYLDSKKAKVKG